jgi:flagellar hook-associated protein 3 FlgL
VRISDLQIFEAAIQSAGRAREAAQSATQQASSGLRVQHPADDPSAAAQIQSFGLAAARRDAVSSGAGLAQAELQGADSALSAIGNAVARAKELAVQLSNSTANALDRSSGATEVLQLIQNAVAAANTRYGSRWIFGGNRDGAEPFDAGTTPGTVAYLGDAGVRQVEIAPGVLQDASIRADVALKGAGGGVDVFATLQSLHDALAADDQAGIQAALGGLDQATDQVARARSEAGVAMDAFGTAVSANKLAAGDARTQASKLGEVDIAQAAIQLTAAQQSLQATLAAAAQSFKLSLLDYL